MANNTYSYQTKCPIHGGTSAIVVTKDYNDVSGVEQSSCTTCRGSWYEHQGKQLKLSDVIKMAPQKWDTGTYEWALECERKNTGWYNPYQSDEQ